jgi:hypothetical protein
MPVIPFFPVLLQVDYPYLVVLSIPTARGAIPCPLNNNEMSLAVA